MVPFPHPAHRTGRAELPHPALGQDLTPSPTAGRASRAVKRTSPKYPYRCGRGYVPPLRHLTLYLRRNHQRNRGAV